VRPAQSPVARIRRCTPVICLAPSAQPASCTRPAEHPYRSVDRRRQSEGMGRSAGHGIWNPRGAAVLERLPARRTVRARAQQRRSRLGERVFILDAPFRSCAQSRAELLDEHEGWQAHGDGSRPASGSHPIQKLTFYKRLTCAYPACTSISQSDVTHQFRRSCRWLLSVIRSRYPWLEKCHDHHRRHRRRPALA
jgi:hypothetical protein